MAFVDDGDERVAMLDLLHTAAPPIILEGPSAVIWRLLEEPCEVAQLVGRLQERYAGSPEEIEAGTRAFLDDLAGRGLVIRAEHG